jgi:hypothetical protein
MITDPTGKVLNKPTGSSKEEPEPGEGARPGQQKPEGNFEPKPPAEEEKESTTDVPTLQEQVKTLKSVNADLTKQVNTINKELARMALNEKKALVAAKLPRGEFRTKDAFEKELERALKFYEVMSLEEIEDYYNTKYAKPITVKSAAIQESNLHEVPNPSGGNDSQKNSSDRAIKLLELGRVNLFGGGS